MYCHVQYVYTVYVHTYIYATKIDRNNMRGLRSTLKISDDAEYFAFDTRC
jgi:hypothetical protein